MTVSKEQASNAIKYLEAAAMNMRFEDEAHEEYNKLMRQGSVATLKEFIRQADQGLTVEQKKNLVENWISTLSVSFGGLDFWRLSKKWKRTTYAGVATMIVDEMDFIMRNNNNPDFNK